VEHHKSLSDIRLTTSSLSLSLPHHFHYHYLITFIITTSSLHYHYLITFIVTTSSLSLSLPHHLHSHYLITFIVTTSSPSLSLLQYHYFITFIITTSSFSLSMGGVEEESGSLWNKIVFNCVKNQQMLRMESCTQIDTTTSLQQTQLRGSTHNICTPTLNTTSISYALHGAQCTAYWGITMRGFFSSNCSSNTFVRYNNWRHKWWRWPHALSTIWA